MQIYYFSRSGNCQKLAEEIGNAQGCTPNQINDGKDWRGAKNFIKAGAAAAKKEAVEVTHPPLVQNEPITLVFPVWAGTLPPAVRSFLQKASTNQVTALAVSAATSLKDEDKRLFSIVYETKGKHLTPPSELLQKSEG